MNIHKIYDKLKEVIDPELGFNIVDLGQIEEVKMDESNVVKIKYLPTTPLCPYLGLIVDIIKNKIKELGYDVEVEVDFENQWDPRRMNKGLRDILGL